MRFSPRLVSRVGQSIGRCNKIPLPCPGRLLPVDHPPVRLRGTACARCLLDTFSCRVGKPQTLVRHLRHPLPGALPAREVVGRASGKPGIASLSAVERQGLVYLFQVRCLLCRVLSLRKGAKLKFQLLTQFMVANPNCS